MSKNRELVSVVIPTMGKRQASLLRAIESVAVQISDVEVEIEILIADDSSNGLDENLIRQAAGMCDLRIIQTSKVRGLARQHGVAAARGQWIAFLDDDDSWDQHKIQHQLKLALSIQASGNDAVISCRLRHEFEENDRTVHGVPKRLIGNENVAEYLFLSRPPNVSRPSIYTSTLFVSASICERVQWRSVPRHQDWDWLVRAQRLSDVTFAQCPEELVTVVVGSNNSISATADWVGSIEWAQDTLKPFVHKHTYADFVMAQPLRYALQARDIHGVHSAIREIASVRTLPTVRSTLTGLGGILSRRMMVRAMSMSHAFKKINGITR